MGAKYLRNITKILKSASGVLFGRSTAGTGRGEELTPAQVRSLLSVYTITQTDTAISTAVNALVAGAPGLLDTLDELSAALGDDANFASTVTTALAGKVDSSSLNESIDDRVAALLVAGTNISLTYNDASGTLTIASTAGGLSGTGSVDNAVLRADGTGGATLQSSAIVIDDLFTASPNNTVNFVCLKPTGGTTNVGVAIVPKGSGAFTLAVPDGTSTGGNARGTNAVDLQATRTTAAQVASGDNAFTSGSSNTASGSRATAIGTRNTVSGSNAGAIGVDNVVTGNNSFCFGNTGSVGHDNALAFGTYAATRMAGMRAVAQDSYDSQGAAQLIEVTNKNKTTSATPVNWDLPLTSGNTYHFNLLVAGVKSDGSAIACYSRRVSAKNVGGTLTIVNNQTIGSDYEDNASTDLTIAASGSNVRVSVTGITGETWRWQFALHGVEIKYGT